MAIFNGSRYAGKTVIEFVRDNKKKQYISLRDSLDKNNLKDDFFLYVVKKDDELDLIASKFGIDPTQWWIIADLNDIFFPLDLKPGTTLIIPNPKILKDL